MKRDENMSKELLIPAGNFDSLNEAIFNGADAIYIGGKNFGARKFASNFTNEEICEAIKLCHLYDVKLYVTMNTLIKDSEVADFLRQVEFLYKNGIDAIIVQDFGMMCLILEKYPNLEVHTSTQANTSSIDTAQFYQSLGVKRVVLSRELSISDINNMNLTIEKEAFIHGALCISYSGCCLMSSMLGGRSGNRGECAGICRLPYSLKYKDKIISKNKYLLSTKELNTSPKIDQLIKSSIYSFKVEGRMKSPEYVGFITKFYRNLIDGQKGFDIEKENDKLKTIFNRQFTLGHLFNENESNLINPNSPNHIGLRIGKVIAVTPKKITIKLDEGKVLNQQDGIRFLNSNKGFIVNYLYDKKNNLIKTSNNICIVDNKINLEKNDIVSKTIDYNLNQELKKLPVKKIAINITVKAFTNKPLEVTISDGKNTVEDKSIQVSEAISSPISKEKLSSQLTKLGNTPFTCQNIQIAMDNNIFISIKEINDIRRSLVEKLIYERTLVRNKTIVREVTYTKNNITPTNKIVASVMSEEQLKACLKMNISRIYVKDKNLFEKYKEHQSIYYELPRCEFSIQKNLESKTLVSDYFDFKKGKQLIGSYGLNVFNIYTAHYLYKHGLRTIAISPELSQEEVISFIKDYYEKFKNYPDIEYLVYGKVENMIIKGNILSLEENDYNYKLIDNKNRSFPTYYSYGKTHILNYISLKNTPVPYLKEHCNLRFDFFDESKETVEITVKNYQ